VRPGFLTLLTLGALLSPDSGATAQVAKPAYKPYVEFTADDTPQQVAAKRAFNEAAQRYNQALYDYHVTLERHDRLVERHNDPAADPAERHRARADALSLRSRLADLRRDVTARATAVDQAARRAAVLGVSTP
jgi:hypothetical protein